MYRFRYDQPMKMPTTPPSRTIKSRTSIKGLYLVLVSKRLPWISKLGLSSFGFELSCVSYIVNLLKQANLLHVLEQSFWIVEMSVLFDIKVALYRTFSIEPP